MDARKTFYWLPYVPIQSAKRYIRRPRSRRDTAADFGENFLVFSDRNDRNLRNGEKSVGVEGVLEPGSKLSRAKDRLLRLIRFFQDRTAGGSKPFRPF